VKTAYLSYDMFFSLLDEVKCKEAQLLFDKMRDRIAWLRECALDETDAKRKAINFAADQFQEALEDYLCNHAQFRAMIDGPDKDPSSN
jgi:hypothetical protein